MFEASEEIKKLTKPLFDIFNRDNYYSTNSLMVRHSFLSTMILGLGVPEAEVGSIDAGIATDAKNGKLFLVSLVTVGDVTNADNYYVVGMHATAAQAADEESTELFPPAIKLKDFAERVGDRKLPEFFDSLPRPTSDTYAQFKLGGTSLG